MQQLQRPSTASETLIHPLSAIELANEIMKFKIKIMNYIDKIHDRLTSKKTINEVLSILRKVGVLSTPECLSEVLNQLNIVVKGGYLSFYDIINE